MSEGTWYKLRSGRWGVKIRSTGRIGDGVEVTNKKGHTKTVWLTNRAAKFDDAELWEVTDEQPGADFEEEPEPF